MKKFFPYFTLLGLTFLALRIALVWNIPVKNQMIMALFGCLSFALFILLIIFDISEFIRIKNIKK
jgi:FtsH-binding integral membrane protein